MNDGEDVKRLVQLFKVTQAVMINRNNMVEESMAEAEEEVKKARKKGKPSCDSCCFRCSTWSELINHIYS